MVPVNESIAHITLADGRRVQVLDADGTDWDEAATMAAVAALIAHDEEAA